MKARTVLTVGAAIWALAAPGVAAGRDRTRPAGRYRVVHLQALSGPTPFPGGCPGAALDEARIPGHELEPMITAEPRGDRRLVATWQQDVGLAARTDLMAWSRDGGRTWRRGTIAGLTACTGGTADAASDPWVSSGAGGESYFVGSAALVTADLPSVAFVAARSDDGGRSWGPLVTVAAADPRNDKPAITADPFEAGRAYATWGNWDHSLSFPLASFLFASSTEDGGATWSAPALVDAPPENALDIPSVVLVPRRGTLVNVFGRVSFFPDFTATLDVLASRSTDGGATWGPPSRVAALPLAPFSDPETGEPLPQPAFHAATAGRDGTLYVAWEHPLSPTVGAIEVARSDDLGATWTVASVTGVGAYAFEPSIAVDGRGTVGITWYDLRNDRPGDGALTADVWFAHSTDRGATWTQRHLAGPTDLRTAPQVAHNRVGEYQGLTALGDRAFGAAFTLASPQAMDGPTDIFFARLEREGD